MTNFNTTQIESAATLIQAKADPGLTTALLLAALVFVVGYGLFELACWSATRKERKL